MSIYDKTEFLKWEAATRDTIDVKRVYVDLCDDLVCGVLFSQLLYYFLPVKNDDGTYRAHSKLIFLDGEYWVAMNRGEWWRECRVAERQVDSCMAIAGVKAEKGGELLPAKPGSKELIVFRTTLIEDSNKRVQILRPNWGVFLERLGEFLGNYEEGRYEAPQPSQSVFSPTKGKTKVEPKVEITKNVISISNPLDGAQNAMGRKSKLRKPTLRNDEIGNIEITDSDITKLPISSLHKDKRQQQEVIKDKTQDNNTGDESFSPLAGVIESALSGVVCSLNSSVVVVSDDENETGEDSENSGQATKRELIAENVTEQDADALLARFGADKCLAALDQRGGIKKLINQLRTLEGKAHSGPQRATIALVEPSPQKSPARATRVATAPLKAIPLPVGCEIDEGDAQAQVTAAYAELGFTGGLKGAARFVERHGVKECAYQIKHLNDAPRDNPGAYLRGAVVSQYRFKSDPIDQATAQAALGGISANLAPSLEVIAAQQAAESSAYDAQFEAMDEGQRARIEKFTMRLVGAFADAELVSKQRRVVTSWAIEGRLDEAEATQDEMDADIASRRAGESAGAPAEQRRKTA